MARSLLEEASRAELRERGLLIDLGTPDQHKYTLGGWHTGWDRSEAAGVTRALAAPQAKLVFHDWRGGLRGLVLRTRALHDGQELSVVLDGQKIGTRRVSRDWRSIEIPVEKPPAPGWRVVSLRFEKGSDDRPAAEVDWVWLRTAPGAAPAGVKVGTVSFGEPRRALLGGPNRVFSYHLQLPEGASLVFDHASDPGIEFLVRATADGSPTRTLTRVQGSERWQEAAVPLGALVGKAVRLDLETRGTGKRAAWGEPDIVRPGRPRTKTVVTTGHRAKNLIYVLIDTARQDVFRPFNPQTEVAAPEMERFAAGATRFTRAYANTNWTKPSIATIWSGLYPVTHGAKTKDSCLSEEVAVLPEHLRRHGFQTAAFIANGYTSDKFGFKRGWDTYRNYIREDLAPEAEHVYDDAIKWLGRRADAAGRFFLYIQTIDPHVPYGVPRDILRRYYEGGYGGRLGPSVSGYETADYNAGKLQLVQEDHRFIRALYNGEITYHDIHFGRFMKHLEQTGLLEDSLVVVSNDHGEEMREHGKYGHGHSLYEELIRSPLLFRFSPLFPTGEENDALVELVDVLPTMLEVLGIEPMKDMEGLSLLAALSGRPALVPDYAVSEYLEDARSVRVGDLKLVRSRSGLEELYNLKDDPSEQQDLARSHPLARRAAEVYLAEGLAVQAKVHRLTSVARSRRFVGKKAVMDPALRRQLKALGYIN